ncbi:Motile sperm domain-containing protein, putative [Ixodes scapularis]|uniref:Motile sperm domain-containing protein 3 n=1 Tax=Ixodes scapularis TaxID=6945 RepID=B7PRU4_IXOSC|nr:Motile sperm domain-containing protein, putative [Ixodes scapularis]|eukprot:XP_002401212.1 Motile sperm domain-containing protein, putative [Ixodes scapularis]
MATGSAAEAGSSTSAEDKIYLNVCKNTGRVVPRRLEAWGLVDVQGPGFLMSAARSGRAKGGDLLVFVFPSELTFCADRQESHKQVLTLYNPYEFEVSFKVLSNAPGRYTVVDPSGVISPKCLVDIAIRHREVCPANYGHTDHIRVHMSLPGGGSLMGCRTVKATLLPTQRVRDASPSGDEEFPEGAARLERSRSGNRVGAGCPPQQDLAVPIRAARSPVTPSSTVIAAAVTCMLALMLPTDGDRTSQLPRYLHVSFNQKLIAAYILGLVTMVIFRY